MIVRPEEGLIQVSHTPSNNFYSDLPYPIGRKPCDADVKWSERYMATTYAGSSAGEFMDSRMEVMAVFGVGGHRGMIVYFDKGGTGKSARNAMRKATRGAGVGTFPRSALHVPEGFRRKAAKVAGCMMLLWDECKGAEDDILKNLISGQPNHVRPPLRGA